MFFSVKSRLRAKRLRSFEGRLAPRLLGKLARSGLLEKSAHSRRMSFLSCRIRGFPEIVKSLAGDPESLSAITRLAMTPLVEAALERDGMIDQVAPGALMAVFNAPFDDPRHAVHACECALAMLQALEKVNASLEHHSWASGIAVGPLGLGIGIHSGEASFGDFGAENCPRYTATGEAVDWADRLEAISAQYGTAILTGGSTVEATEKTFAFLEVDLLASGNGAEKPIYALLGTPLSRANPKFLALKTFHERIFASINAREWDNARTLIQQARSLAGANPILYDLYLERIGRDEAVPLVVNAPRPLDRAMP